MAFRAHSNWFDKRLAFDLFLTHSFASHGTL